MKKSELRELIKESLGELKTEGFLDSLGTVLSPKGSFQQIANQKLKSKRAQNIYDTFRDKIIKSYVVAYGDNTNILRKIYQKSSSARDKEPTVERFIYRFNKYTNGRYDGKNIKSMTVGIQKSYVDSILKFINLKPSYMN